MDPRQLLEAFLTPPKVRELTREQELLDRAQTSRVQLKGTGFARGVGEDVQIYRWGRGPAVLLVHGWGSRASHFEALVTALEAGGFQAVAFDAPGHGRSGGIFSSAPAFAAAIGAVAAQEDAFTAVVAHSLGALATAQTLGKTLRAGRVALLGSCCWVEPLAVAFGRGQAAPQPSIDAMIALAHAEFRPEETSAEISAPALGNVPALLMHDPSDAEMPCEHSRALAAVWPGARLVETPGVGHRRILRARDIVTRTMEHITG